MPRRPQLRAMRMHASLVIGLLLLMVSVTHAQSTGTLRFLVDPGHDFSFIVDGKHRMQQREVKLSEGLHRFAIWAPTRTIVDTAVFVVADRTSDLVVRLPFSPEFIAYKAELSRFQVRKRWTRSAPLIALAGGLTWTAISLGRYGEAKDVLGSDRDRYDIDVAPASIEALKNTTIPAHNRDLQKARTDLWVATGFTLASAAATVWLVRRTARWERPQFEDREKVRFDGLAWSPSRKGGAVTVGLSIPLAR